MNKVCSCSSLFRFLSVTLLSASAFVSVCVVLFSRAHGCGGAWCLWQMKTDSPFPLFLFLYSCYERTDRQVNSSSFGGFQNPIRRVFSPFSIQSPPWRWSPSLGRNWKPGFLPPPPFLLLLQMEAENSISSFRLSVLSTAYTRSGFLTMDSGMVSDRRTKGEMRASVEAS